MSATTANPDNTVAAIGTHNVLGSLGTTLVGVAMAAPTIAHAASTFTLPASPTDWLQAFLGVLAIFAR